MKKYRSLGKYQRYNSRRSKRAISKLHAINRFAVGLKRTGGQQKGKPHDRSGKYKYIYAPGNFTLVGNANPEEIVGFINRLKNALEKRRAVFVVLRYITKIDTDAIIVLLAAIVRFKALKVRFNGDVPDNYHCKEFLIQSGFFRALAEGKFLDQTNYQIGSPSRTLFTHASKKVDSVRTAEIIEGAAETIWGRRLRCQGIQTTFLELMQNTVNHASLEKEGDKHWWLSVKHDQKENKVRFAFVDYGVGVFTSLASKPSTSRFYGSLEKIYTKFRYGDNAELLRLILNGELHRTVTEDYYRGQGLPGMVDSLKDNWFSNLHIITNNVYADVSSNKYKVMNADFGGTFIYWEVGASNRSFPLAVKYENQHT